jgi:predicted nuclease of predicted toxin-antitoxin system
MRYLADAQLPRRLALAMGAAGLDVLHTLDLPEANRTKDGVINTLSLEQERIVITKDEDFVQSFILQGRPYKLLLVSTGNITNKHLLELFARSQRQVNDLFSVHRFIELTRDLIIVHD